MMKRTSFHQIVNIHRIIQKAREFQKKNIYFCFIDYTKAFDCVDLNKLWKILREMGIPHHLTCFLKNLYAGLEATVRTRYGATDRFQIGKGVHQGCHSAYLTYMQSTSCKIQAGWSTSWNQDCGEKYKYLRYANGTTLMAEAKTN